MRENKLEGTQWNSYFRNDNRLIYRLIVYEQLC